MPFETVGFDCTELPEAYFQTRAPVAAFNA